MSTSLRSYSEFLNRRRWIVLCGYLPKLLGPTTHLLLPQSPLVLVTGGGGLTSEVEKLARGKLKDNLEFLKVSAKQKWALCAAAYL